jgi:hypothetical protein
MQASPNPALAASRWRCTTRAPSSAHHVALASFRYSRLKPDHVLAQARNDAHHAFSMRPFDGLGGSGLAGAYDRRKIMLRSAVGNKAMSQCSQRAGHGDQANAPPTIDPLSDLLAQLSQFGPGDLRGGRGDPSQSSGLPQSSSLLYAGGQGSSSRAALQQQLRSDTGMASTFGWLTDAGASTRTSPRRCAHYPTHAPLVAREPLRTCPPCAHAPPANC